MNDDYIKFIRYAHWKIENSGAGIVGIITNNSFIDGININQMRRELLNSFDKIYIMNLRGHKKDPDQNVFDIRMGVCIILMVKLGRTLNEKEV